MDSNQDHEVNEVGPQPGPQEDFSRCEADIAIYGGAAFGGKSFALVLDPIRGAVDPRFNGVIFRREMPQITAGGGLWDTSKQIYPHTGAEAIESRHLWKWPIGAEIKFTHLQLEKDKESHQGSAYVFLGFDELTHFSATQFWYLFTRNRPPSGYYGRCWCRATTNPDADSWVRQFIDWWIGTDGYPIKERSGVLRYFTGQGDKILWVDADWRDEYGNPAKTITFIPSTIEDNPAGNAADPSYRSNLLSQDEVTKERLLRGNWNITYRGGMFNPDWFKVVPEAPRCPRRVRYWDLASTPKNENDSKDPDWTVGALVGEYQGDIYILDIQRLRATPADVEERVKTTAQQDGIGVLIAFEEEHGASGKYTSQHFISILKGYDVWPDYVTGEKVERAKPWAAEAQHGHVSLVEAPWNRAFLAEAGSFPLNKRDQIDSVSGAVKVLKIGKKVWPFFNRGSEEYCRDFKLEWKNYYHYGAVVISKEMKIYVLAAMYHKVENRLYVYGELVASQMAVSSLADRIVTGMGFAQPDRIIHGLYAPQEMFSDKDKSAATSINAEIRRAATEKKCKSMAYIQPAQMYDRMGSITHTNLLFHNKEIVFHSSCKEAARQASSWRIENGRPLETGFELCECLCLIVSSVNRILPKKPAKPPMDPHYKPRATIKTNERKKANSWQIA